jgi:cell division transport system permease protein
MKNKRQKVRKQRFFNSNLTTTISISLVLFLVGVISLIMLFSRDLGNYIKESINFSIVIQDNMPKKEFESLKETLTTASFVKEFKHVDKEQAIRDLAEELGDDPEDLLGYNPLLASFEVKLHANYANMDSIQMIEKQIGSFVGIKQIIYHKNFIDQINQNIKKIMLILSSLSLIFLFISIGLINNTIRLHIYNKRFTINTMQLVGATSWFIKKPFIWRNIRNGFIAAILALSMLGGAIYYIQNNIMTSMNIYRLDILLITLGIVFSLALILSSLSAIAAVNKYLRIETNELYYL